MTKKYFSWVVVVLGVIALLGIIFNSYAHARERALVAEARVGVLEEERLVLEEEFEEATRSYEALLVELDESHDSIAEVRGVAIATATEASVSFDANVGVLRDSLEAYEGLEAILDTIQATHVREVEAYQEQVQTLEADNALLWKRVEAVDSMWIREQEINSALRREISALHEEADAWEDLATPGIIGRIGGSVPYILGGVAIGVLVGSGG